VRCRTEAELRFPANGFRPARRPLLAESGRHQYDVRAD
jgi:hypothetical protein